MPLTARRLRSDELHDAGRLRHAFFVRQKSWVPASAAGTEVELDDYDRSAIHLGVFDGPSLVGYMRAVAGESAGGFMLDREFRECLSDEEYATIVRPGSVELSRRVIAEHLSPLQAKPVAGLLFKLFYVVVVEERFSNIYLVQEPSYSLMLRKLYGLAFAPINARPYRFPDGTTVNVDHGSVEGLLRALDQHGRRAEYEDFRARYVASSSG